MKNMKINSVKLINGGSKGIEVKYALPNNKDREYVDDTLTHKKKTPIHSELEETFGWLKGHLLDICGYSIETRDKDIVDTEMVSVTYNDKGFVIVGKKAILDSEKTINLVTPLISDPSEYLEFGKVCAILDGIYEETKSYMAGDKVLSDTQLIMKFKANDETFDAESFKSLSAEEQRDFATKILEEMGSLIIHGNEMVAEEEEDFEGTGTEEEARTNKEEIVSESLEFEGKSEATAVEEKATPAVHMVKKDNNEFSIIMNPVVTEKSTAKKKVKVA